MIDAITASLERRLHTTPHDMMVSEALIAIRALITERDALTRENARLQTIVAAARAVHTAYHGDPAVISLAAAWAALEAAIEGVDDA